MKKLLIIIAILFFITSPLYAASYCMTPTGAGTKSGADWDNAMQWNSGAGQTAFARDNIYYLAGGTYEKRTLSTAVDGTKVIEIRKATVADHVSDTGWSASYGTNEALITATNSTLLTISTSYWKINGVSRTDWTTGYGIRLLEVSPTGAKYGVLLSDGASNITVTYVDINMGGQNLGDDNGNRNFYSVAASSNLSITYSYLHNSNDNIFVIYNANGLTIDHCYISDNYSSLTWHGQGMQFSGNQNVTISNNKFVNLMGQGTPTLSTASGNSDSNYYIYNNIYSGGPAYAITIYDTNIATGIYVYNNTFANIASNGGIYVYDNATCATNCFARNNLFYNCGTTHWHVSIDHDYSWHYDSDPDGTLAGETHDVTGSGDPFLDSASSDFRIKSDSGVVGAGTDLSATFTTDILGLQRNTWDIGAYRAEQPRFAPWVH